MAITSVNLPAHMYSHTEVSINDNTIRTYARAATDNCKILAVFISPKGRDRKMMTIEGGLSEFDKTFGVGPFSTYGQPLLNARAAAATEVVTLQCMRLTAPDATYANNVIWAQYRVAMKQFKKSVLKEEFVLDPSKRTFTDADYDVTYEYKDVFQVRYVTSPARYVTDLAAFNEDFESYTKLTSEALNAKREDQQAAGPTSKMLLPIPELIDSRYKSLKNPTDSSEKTETELLQDELWEEYLKYTDLQTYEQYVSGVALEETDTRDKYFEVVKTRLRAQANEELKKVEFTADPGEVTGYKRIAVDTLDVDTYNSTDTAVQAFYHLDDATGNYVLNTTDVEGLVLAESLTVEEYTQFITANAVYTTLYEAELSGGKTAEEKKADEVDKMVETRIKKYQWQQMPFMSVASLGRGIYGNAFGVRLSNHPRADKSNVYKNYYYRVFEGSTSVEGPVRVTLTENAISGTQSYFIEEVVNGIADDGSINVRVKVNTQALPTLFANYDSFAALSGSSITEDSFDPILGINKIKAGTRSQSWEKFAEAATADVALDNFEIVDYDKADEDVQFNRTLGIALTNGSDGMFSLATDKRLRDQAIRTAYYDAFTGETDPDIMSKTKFPLDAVFDAAFPFGYILSAGDPTRPKYERSIKCALADLVDKRYEDCFCFLDLGTDKTSSTGSMEYDDNDGFITKEQSYEYADELDDSVKWWTYSIDAYYGKIRDPYNKKIVTVSSTYNLIVNYPKHWKTYGGKHVPYAGSKYGVIDQYIKGTVFPTFDVDLDSVILDNLTDQHINYAQIDAKGNIIRGAQSTRYPEIGDALTISNLSEINNALIILDIKKDAIKLVTDYAYNFNEASDLSLFNREASQLVNKYASAQVKSISATFSRTDEEAELGILHLYITVVHKALVKINLIDIDVNRAVTSDI